MNKNILQKLATFSIIVATPLVVGVGASAYTYNNSVNERIASNIEVMKLNQNTPSETIASYSNYLDSKQTQNSLNVLALVLSFAVVGGMLKNLQPKKEVLA